LLVGHLVRNCKAARRASLFMSITACRCLCKPLECNIASCSETDAAQLPACLVLTCVRGALVSRGRTAIFIPLM
jgi:hypothetical protein